jgi:hypothetical protein
MEILNNIQDIVFENSEKLENNTYIKLQNELMKLHKKLQKDLNEYSIQSYKDLLTFCNKLEDEIVRIDALLVDSNYDVTDGFWECFFCHKKESYRDTNALYIYKYTDTFIGVIGRLYKIYCCHCCSNNDSKIIKTDYIVKGTIFCMIPKVHLTNDIPELEGVKYQYLNRKYLNLSIIIDKIRRKKKLEDIQKHFGIELVDSDGNTISNTINSSTLDVLKYQLLLFKRRYAESFNTYDNKNTELLKVLCTEL